MSQREDSDASCLPRSLRADVLQRLRRLGLAESPPSKAETENPWLTVKGAAERARCGVKTIYREVSAGRLRAARVGGRRELRIRPEWIDEWLQKATTLTEVA